MTGTLVALGLSVSAFVGSHFLLSGRRVRHALVAWVGEMAFLGVCTSIALATFVWMVEAYADAPYLELWLPPTALRHLALSVMPFACILVVSGLTTPSPAAVSLDPQALAQRAPVGIQKVTRHPVLWGFTRCTSMRASTCCSASIGGASPRQRRSCRSQPSFRAARGSA